MAKNLIVFVLFLSLGILILGISVARPASATGNTIWIATVRDTINPMISEYLTDTITKANSENIHAIILELDTPGGLVDSTRIIVQDIMNSNIPIITYVSPKGARAASAGMFITVASHVAAMAPVTNIGAAHPISMGPGGPMDQDKKNSEDSEREEDKTDDRKEISCSVRQVSDSQVMEDKILNDMLAWSRTIAENRGRNVEWVISAVKDSTSSTEKEALKAGVIDLICNDISDLLTQLEGREVVIGDKTIELSTKSAFIVNKGMSRRQKFLSAMINPTLAIYLMALGGLGLYFELSHPGFIAPGVIGGICLILGLFAMHTLPISYAGLLLILLSFVFFALEVKVTSYGGLTIGGIAAFVLGSSMLVDSKVSGMKVSMLAVAPLAVGTALVTIVLLTLTVRAHSKPVQTGEKGMNGLKGHVTRDLTPVGQVFVRGEIWRAQSEDQTPVLENTKVIVVTSVGLTLIVRPCETDSAEVSSC